MHTLWSQLDSPDAEEACVLSTLPQREVERSKRKERRNQEEMTARAARHGVRRAMASLATLSTARTASRCCNSNERERISQMSHEKDKPSSPTSQDKSPEFIRLCQKIHDRGERTGDWTQVQQLQDIFRQAIDALGHASQDEQSAKKRPTQKRHAKA